MHSNNILTVHCRYVGISAFNIKLHDLKVKICGTGNCLLKQKVSSNHIFGIGRQRTIKWSFYPTDSDIFELKVKSQGTKRCNIM